jgi:hypothetical protein
VVQPSSDAAAAADTAASHDAATRIAGALGSSSTAADTTAAIAAGTTERSSNTVRGRRAAAAGVARLVQAEMLNTNMLAMQAAVDGGWRQSAHPLSQASAMPVAQTEVQESLVQAQVGFVVTKAGATRVVVR